MDYLPIATDHSKYLEPGCLCANNTKYRLRKPYSLLGISCIISGKAVFKRRNLWRLLPDYLLKPKFEAL